MAASEQIEIERKYGVDTDATVPDLTAVDGVASVESHDPFTLTAVYYDTDTLDLAAHSISLRRRSGGGDEGWHIKKPVDEGRTELHWPLHTGQPEPVENSEPADETEAAPEAVPEEVLEPVRSIVRDRPVSPIARLTTSRTTVHLMNDRGEAVAELADDQVQASDVRSGEVRAWREWEVEFLAAAPDTREERTAFLDAIEQQLATAGAHPSASRSKLAQALGSHSLPEARAGAAAADQGDRELATDAGSAASVIVQALRHQVADLVAADPAVRADEPDAVHQMRRSVRKLRSLLATYGRLFDEEPVDRLRDDLKRLGAALGVARDAEVRRDRADSLLDSLSSQDPFVRQRLVGGDQREYDEALSRLRQLITSEHYVRLLDALDEFVRNPPLTDEAAKPADAVIREALLRQVKRLRKRAKAVQALDAAGGDGDDGGGGDGGRGDGDGDGRGDGGDDDDKRAHDSGDRGAGNDGGGDGTNADAAKRDAALHEVRKAARRLRYSITALTVPGAYRPAPEFRRIAAAVKPLEKSLGRRHDQVIFAEQVRIAAQRARAQGEDTFLYGQLAGAPGESPAGADPADSAVDGSSRDPLVRELDKTMRTFRRLTRKL